MLSLFIFILISISATNIVSREFIFEWLRKLIQRYFPYSMLQKIINCETCLGFWIGLCLCLLFPMFNLHWFIGGLISSISCKTYTLLLIKF